MASDDRLIGRQLASFRIERVLGRGGMATVYYGWDVRLERPVAVKVIDPRFQDDPMTARRFVNEARTVATWHHPNILQVYYADDADGLYYFVMEYVPGLDLGAVLDRHRRRGTLPAVSEVMRIGRAAAAALDFAHARGVIHRDVKPGNILVAEYGRIVVADFGLALNVAHGTLGTVLGSPLYIAPEQARNSSEVVPQSDVYSLGVVLYEMLAGRVPFEDSSPLAVAQQHVELAPPSPRRFNPALSADVETVLLKALQKSPKDRYQTCEELVSALGRALDVAEPTMPFLHTGPRLRPPAALARLRQLTPKLLWGRIANDPSVHAAADGLASIWSMARSHPVSGRVINYLARSPVGRAAAGSLLALFLIEMVWFAGVSFQLGRAAEAMPLGATGTPSAARTAANTPQPTGTIQAGATVSPAPPAATNSPSATNPPAAVHPAATGDHFALYYDDTALYFKNLSGKDRSINPFAFERLDSAGKPLNRFDGSRWGVIYSDFRAGYCEVVQLIDYRDHFQPPDCANRYVVIRTPFASDPGIFWTNQPGSDQFRVLWNDNEVGRCKIAAKSCDVYLP